MIEAIKKKYRNRDRYIRVLSKSGTFRVVAIRNTTTALTAQNSHQLDEIPAFFLAKTLTAASMIAAFLKGEERIIVDINSNGIINKCYAEAMQVGECRGFVRLSDSDNDIEINDLSDVLGEGTLKVSRVLYNQSEPVNGIVELQNGDIANNIAYYFHQSEQIGSAALIDVKFDTDGKIKSSGGMLVQAMPGATNNEIEDVIKNVAAISFCNLLDKYESLEDVLKEALPFEFDVIKTNPVDFYCRCNIKQFKNQLLLLGEKELKEMQKRKHNELVCQFCNKHYNLTTEDFDELLCQLKAQTN